jgi:hypothetical protein
MVTSLSIGRGGLGRFGNNMWTIAGVIGIATKNGHQFAFPEWKNYDNALFGGNADLMRDYFVNPLPLIPDGLQWQEIGYKWEYEDVRLGPGNYDIFRHLQSPRYFEHCIDLVRHYFTLKNEPGPNDFCAIHYRAGDYIDDPNAFHPRLPAEYYREAMRRMPEGTRYIVFSDDISEAQERIGIAAEYVSGHYLHDFSLMKSCRHFIIANSSFSAMAALLADQPGKIIVSPRKWFGGEGASWDTTQIHHPNWIQI